MTKEEIRDMVKEADLDWHTGWTLEDDAPNRFETFAKLVAEKEREDCIKIVMQGTGEPVQRKTLDILHQERTRIALAIKGQE